jgi:rubrerythrin
MNNFVCLNCKYRFRAKEQPRTCPYCDKGAVELESSAEDIVSEVESLME